MVSEKDRFMINDKIYYKLIQFLDKKSNKRFYIYTDNYRDNNGNLKLYSSIVLDSYGKTRFLPVTRKEDIELVKQAIFKVKLGMLN